MAPYRKTCFCLCRRMLGFEARHRYPMQRVRSDSPLRRNLPHQGPLRRGQWDCRDQLCWRFSSGSFSFLFFSESSEWPNSCLLLLLLQGRHQLRKPSESHISRLARCGSGLWVSYENSYLVSLFHVETFKFLQEINIASNINRILAERESDRSARDIFVTRYDPWIITCSTRFQRAFSFH